MSFTLLGPIKNATVKTNCNNFPVIKNGIISEVTLSTMC
jgi:hypothetical protein